MKTAGAWKRITPTLACAAIMCLRAGAGVAAPEHHGRLDGSALPWLAGVACYRVKQRHVKEAGVLRGEYDFSFMLCLATDERKFKFEREKYDDGRAIPRQVTLKDIRYVSARAGREKAEMTEQDFTREVEWVRKEEGFFCSHLTYSRTSRFVRMLELELVQVWLPALYVRFPKELDLVHGFTWDQAPLPKRESYHKDPPAYRWRVTDVKRTGDGHLFTVCAESRDASGLVERRVEYDTTRGMAVRSTLVFVPADKDVPERIEITMELAEEK